MSKKENIPVSGVVHSNEQEMLIIRLAPESSSVVKPGEELMLSMNFTSQLSDQMKGFYYSSYSEDGEEKYRLQPEKTHYH